MKNVQVNMKVVDKSKRDLEAATASQSEEKTKIDIENEIQKAFQSLGDKSGSGVVPDENS